MAENNVWGEEGAKIGTEGPQDQRSEAGKVKAESSLEATGSLAPVYRVEGIQDWEHRVAPGDAARSEQGIAAICSKK